MKSNVFFFTFQGLSVAKSCLRPEIAPLTILAIKEFLCDFTKALKSRHFMGHSATDLKF